MFPQNLFLPEFALAGRLAAFHSALAPQMSRFNRTFPERILALRALCDAFSKLPRFELQFPEGERISDNTPQHDLPGALISLRSGFGLGDEVSIVSVAFGNRFREIHDRKGLDRMLTEIRSRCDDAYEIYCAAELPEYPAASAMAARKLVAALGFPEYVNVNLEIVREYAALADEEWLRGFQRAAREVTEIYDLVFSGRAAAVD